MEGCNCRECIEVQVLSRLNVIAEINEITLSGNAKPEDVVRGVTFYNNDPYEKKVGTLDAYSVVQTLLPNNKCRIEIKTLGLPDSDIVVAERNISLYKFQDQQRIIREGGELASDEEYIETEKYLQDLYKRIMGVEENG